MFICSCFVFLCCLYLRLLLDAFSLRIIIHAQAPCCVLGGYLVRRQAVWGPAPSDALSPLCPLAAGRPEHRSSPRAAQHVAGTCLSLLPLISCEKNSAERVVLAWVFVVIGCSRVSGALSPENTGSRDEKGHTMQRVECHRPCKTTAGEQMAGCRAG